MDNKQKKFQILAGVIGGIGLLAIILVSINKFLPTSERMSPNEYYGSLAENEAAVVVGDHVAQERALILDGSAYIDYTLVQSELNSRFYWDASVSLLLFTTAEQVFEIAPNSSIYTVDGESYDAGYEILKTTSSGMFLSTNFMQLYSNLHCEILESPSRVVVTFGSTERTVATVKRDSVIRYLGGIKSPIITDVAQEAQVTVLVQMDNWSQVLTADGYIGYIRNGHLTDIHQETTETWYQGPEYTSISLEDKVNLVWHQIDYPEMNNNLTEDIAGAVGVNVISPTWYFLSDNTGAVDSFASASYVEQAHGAGLQVWALVSNFSENVSTTTLLSSRAARQNLQNYLIGQAQELGFDGINIDLEGIAQEAGYSYVQFMRELSILCRKNGIILSVDVPVPMDFSQHYNRQELGVVCDYVIMMGYDEHYNGSETAGSVASMDFERTGIENMLTEVQASKVISGIPFYSRVWYTDTGDGSVTSEVITMDEGAQIVADLGLTPVYDESTGQQYVEWTDEEGRLCQIWLEDESSIAQRAALVSEYGVGGIAEWVLGRESSYVWEIIQNALR